MPPPANPLNALPANERAGALQRIVSDLLQAAAERDALRSVNATLCKQIAKRDAKIAQLKKENAALDKMVEARDADIALLRMTVCCCT